MIEILTMLTLNAQGDLLDKKRVVESVQNEENYQCQV